MKILLGLLVFIGAVLYKTPTKVVSPYIPTAPLYFEGVTGSLWKGEASELTFDGVRLGAVRWTMNPLALVIGKVNGTFIIDGNELSAKGNYSSSFNGQTLSLDNTQFNAKGSFINKTQKYARLSGNLRGFIDHLEIQQPFTAAPPLLSGMLNWERGGLTSPINLPDGNYQFIFKPEAEGKTVTTISSKNAPVDVKGNAILHQNWTYQTNIKIKALPKGKSIQGMLNMVGRPQADGYIHINQSGTLIKNK